MIDSLQRCGVNDREGGYGLRPQMYASACISHPPALSSRPGAVYLSISGPL